jgi:4-hydroxythreonine-4-phosphate dehydrogenase
MLERAGLLGYGRFWHLLDAWPDSPLDPGLYWLTPASLLDFNAQPGQASLEGGRAAAESLLSACQALEHRQAKALVTCPLNKAMLQAAGYDFPGHTEFLAQYFGLRPDEVCMHLAGPRLRVSLATTHPPLRLVPWLISPEKIARYLELTWKLVLALETSPRPIAVCGLNPHAGESGAIGDEEQRLITPGIRMAVSRGTRVIGPLAADTVFYRAWQGEFSAVLAMYHDQGLGPLKLVHFGQSVNITLGLPVIRTSVDHGT